MNVPVFDHKDQIVRFVEQGLWGGSERFGECSAIGFANEKDGLVAGIVYHNYSPSNGTIELSAYSTCRDWTTRDYIALIFGKYPFLQLGCRIAFARHSEHNKRARRIWKALGADEYVIADFRNDGEAEVLAVLKRDKFLASKFMRNNDG